MPKVKIVCLILATVLASVGTIIVVSNLGGGEIPPLDVPTEDINTYLDRPEGLTPADVEDVRENLFIAHKVLLMQQSFYGVSEGYTTSFGISQQVLNTRYVVGEFGNKNSFKEMVTKGVVPNAYQLYMWGDNYIYRSFNKVNALDDVDWRDSANKLNEDDFYNKFGHRSDKLTGYILNYDTVTNGVFEGVSDGIYTYRFSLDTTESTAFLRKEMVTNGNLSGYPTFHKAEIVVTMDGDWNVKTLTTDCEYTAKTMGISARCSEDITETFYEFEGDLPEKDFFEQFFDSDYSDVMQDKGALDVLLDIFSPYLNGEDLQVALDVAEGDTQYAHGLVSISGLDISDLSKLSVSARIGNGLDVGYEHGESKIYLKYQDFQASTTVDGVLGLVDTLLPLFGDGGAGLGDAFGDIDLDALLNDLNYEISEDGTKCVVSLPLSLAGLNIDAKLFADVDGENYTFTSAVVTLGELKITLAPETWSVAERVGAYPEILGLADLIQNGKIALSAQLALAFDGVNYDVEADALVDLATLNVALNANLGDNGSLSAVLYDKILYAQYGEIKVKLDTANVSSLVVIIEKLAGKSLSMELPEVSVSDILALLSTVTATNVDDGRVTVGLSLGELNCNVYLASLDGRWNIDSIAISYSGISATLAPSNNYGEVTAPADADAYVDVTELLETFAEPIARIINGESFGAVFTLNLTVGGKTYRVNGSVAVDVYKNLSVSATVFDGNLGVLDANVVYANDTVYLTVNGIKVAFGVSGGDKTDVDVVETISNLLSNEQIASLLSEHEQLNALVQKVVEIIENGANFDVKQLLAVDFREVITRFEFNDGVLSLSVDASALGFDVAADLALSSDNGDLKVALSGLQIASIELGLTATVATDVEPIQVPNAEDYILNLHGSVLINGIALDLEITADLLNMDVWATAQVLNETIQLRYVDGAVYAIYGNVRLKLDTANIDEIIGRFSGLFGAKTMSLGDVNINEILSSIKFDLNGATPNISIAIAGIVASVNFTNVDGVLKFKDISLSYGENVSATVERNGRQATQLDVSGEFVDGNALIDSVLDTVDAFLNANGVTVELLANVTLSGRTYGLGITLKYNEGLFATLTLEGEDGALVTAEVYFVDGVLYFDVNGIRQAIAIDLTAQNSLDGDALQQLLAQLEELIDELDNEKLNGIVASVKNTFDKLANANISEIISLFRFEDGKLTVGVDLSQLDLDDFTVVVGLGQDLTLAVDGLKIATAEIALVAGVKNSSEKISAPDVDTYVNELMLTVGGITAFVKLDLYHKTVIGQAELFGGTAAFKYVDGAVYLTYGGVSVVVPLSEIDTLIDAISKFVELPELSMGDVDIIGTVKNIFDNLQFAKESTENGYALTLGIDGVSVTANFVRVDGKVAFDGATVAAGEISVAAASVENINFTDVDTDGYFVDVCELAEALADGIASLVEAEGYAIDVNGNATVGGNTYSLNAHLTVIGGNVYAYFKLGVGNANMLEGQLWIVGNVLYLDAGDLKLSVNLPETTGDEKQLTVEDVKQTLGELVGYNSHLDDLIELALNVLDTQMEDLSIAELLSKFTLVDGNLTLGVDGAQFGLSQFELALGATEKGVLFALSSLSYKDISVDLSGSASSFTGEIAAPNGDFTTNLKVIIDEHNTLYANIDLLNKVIKLQLVSISNSGKTTTLDILYTLSDNIIKITNSHNLYVSANIDNIVEIVNEIDSIVAEFAGTEATGALSGLSGLGNVDLKAIVQSLQLTTNGNSVELTLKALGFNVSVVFARGGLDSVVLPITDGITLTVKTDSVKANYATFSDNVKYVRIDEVFNDYFYGESEEERGAIDTLIHTNSWRFDFNSDSEIAVTNDDGTTDKFQIAAGSFLVFYYNVADAENFKIRAKINVNKFDSDKWKEFMILDVAYIDGRIYVNYDSNSSNKNVLKATVSLDAIKECINLLPSLYKVVPQIEDLINSLKESMSEAQGSITLGNLASLFDEVTYSDDKVFTLSLNDGIIDGLGKIYLSAQQYGNVGLQLNQLLLGYNNISVSLSNIVVTASPNTVDEDGNKSFDFVNDYVLTYLNENGGYGSFMNLDSIRELLAGFVITADNVDADGNRAFALQGTVHANMIGLAKVDIQIYVNVDIDKDNNVYLAVKIHRDSATGLAGGLAYDDEGGDSYLLLNGKDQVITLARNSIQKQTWCSQNGFHCTNTSTIHKVNHLTKREISDYDYKGKMSYLVENLTLKEFTADTATMVNYILELVNFTSTIEKPIKNAIGKENTNVYGIEDILKSYSYSYNEAKAEGTFAVGADLSPIDSALGELTVNILHVGNFDDVYYDDDGIFHDGGGTVGLTQINGAVSLIKVMDATFELNLVEPTTGLAHSYVAANNYLW